MKPKSEGERHIFGDDMGLDQENFHVREGFIRKSDNAIAKVVSLPENSIPEFPGIKALAYWLMDMLAEGGNVTIKSTGQEARFSRGNVRASVKRARSMEHRNAYGGLREMVENAEYDHYEIPDARHSGRGGQDVYHSALSMGGKLYSVRLKLDVVTEKQKAAESGHGKYAGEDVRYKDHKLTEIEIAFIQDHGFANNGKAAHGTNAISGVTLGVLRGSVKPSRLEEHVLSRSLPESSRMLNDFTLQKEKEMSTSKPNKKEEHSFHEEFAGKIIEMLENGLAPWQTPWHSVNQAPRNPLSGVAYKGVNRVFLTMSEVAAGYNDPRWMTLKQANNAGYKIKKGSRSTPVVYYQNTKEQDKLDAAGKPVLGEDGKPERETVRLARPILRMAHVFNAQQVENFPPMEQEKTFAWDPQEKAEAVLASSGAVIKHDQRDRAFYNLKSDEIHLPPKDKFDAPDKYYATALHELGHWTGHPKRMKRAFGPYGSADYAKEELRAEIASWMVGQDIGVGHDPGQHASYVQSWIAALKKDPMEIMRACRDAQEIHDYVLGLEMQKDKAVEQEISKEKAPAEPTQTRTWLHVPYRDKDAAKGLGARWDREQKQWYAPEGTDLAPLRRFMQPREHAPARNTAETLDPQREFARKLEEMGLDLKGQLPELDGQIHRVPLLDKDGRGRDGSYCLYNNGVPAGWAKNHVTGEYSKLVATGVVLSPEERERQKQERAARLQAAEAERARAHDAAAQRCRDMWNSFAPATSSPYLEQKNVQAFGLKEDQGNLIVPLRNIDGELRGFQAIMPDGSKVFATGMEKKGNFHMLNEEGKDLSSGEIILCEGYATGASIHEATGKPVAVSFDSGNMIHVAEALRDKYPKAAITICADNDHALMRDGKPYNVGVERAKMAAEKVGGKVRIPIFSEREKAQGLTDFNDLHKSRGLAALREQLGMARGKEGLSR